MTGVQTCALPILRLEISAVTPLVDEHNHLVIAVYNVTRDIEFRAVMAALAVAYVSAVDIQLQARRHAQEGKNMSARVINCKLFAVKTYAVEYLDRRSRLTARQQIVTQFGRLAHISLIRGNIRRMRVKLISDVDIKRLLISLELPASRDGYLLKIIEMSVELFRHIGYPGVILEIPILVKHSYHATVIPLGYIVGRQTLFFITERNKVSACRQLILLKNRKVVKLIVTEFIYHIVNFLIDTAIARCVINCSTKYTFFQVLIIIIMRIYLRNI